jgi:hypothetical protein
MLNLLYRRGGLSHTLSHSLSHTLSHGVYPTTAAPPLIVLPGREGIGAGSAKRIGTGSWRRRSSPGGEPVGDR